MDGSKREALDAVTTKKVINNMRTLGVARLGKKHHLILGKGERRAQTGDGGLMVGLRSMPLRLGETNASHTPWGEHLRGWEKSQQVGGGGNGILNDRCPLRKSIRVDKRGRRKTRASESREEGPRFRLYRDPREE